MLHWLMQSTPHPAIAQPFAALKTVGLNLASLPPIDRRTAEWMLRHGHSPMSVMAVAAAVGDTEMLTILSPQLSRKQLQRAFQQALLNAAINNQGVVLDWLMAPGRLEQAPGQAALTYQGCAHCRDVWTAVFVEVLAAVYVASTVPSRCGLLAVV